MTRSLTFVSLSAVVAGLCVVLAGQERGAAGRLPSTASGDWPHYTAD